ncbi:MAG: hypothetical protein JW881_03235 [Spirochaetales bacterium]|nr:hypothetical protein [Spirochaetales bacterium]
MKYADIRQLCFESKGKLIRKISVRDEWIFPVKDPAEIMEEIKKRKLKADILTVVQNIEETEPKYLYYREPDNIAALPISTYEDWFSGQIHTNVRNKIRKSEKKGINVKIEKFDDNLILGLMDIFNETPIRRGKKYSYFGKDFSTVKKGWATDLERSEFLVAYHEKEKVGFIKLCYGDEYARTSGTIAKISHRDKSPMNALFSAAVKRCAEKGCSYLVYGKFVYGKKGEDSLTTFKKYNGFLKIEIPRYFIPLTFLGDLAIKTGLHHGMKAMIPKFILNFFLNMRTSWYKTVKKKRTGE